MTTPTLDNDLFPYAEMSLDVVGTAIEGGRSLSGATQAIDYSGGGFWKLECRRLQLLSIEQHRYLNKLAALLNGSTRTINVPFITSYIEPGGTYVVPSGPVALGATSISLEGSGLHGLSGGEIFSISHSTMGKRCYRIREVTSTVSDLYTVSIAPPIRQSMSPPTDGTAIDFTEPTCLMRLLSGSTIPWEVRDWWVGGGSVTFVEAFGAI